MCRNFNRLMKWNLLVLGGWLIVWSGTAVAGGVIPPKQDPDKIEWVEGEVLVKFKDDVEIRPAKGQWIIRTNLSSITALNRKYEVKEMEKVFKTAEKRTEPKYIKTYTDEVIEVPQLFNWYKFKVSEESNVQAIVDAYKSDPNVEYAEPNYIARICATPNDPDFSQQWGLPAIHAPEAWDIEKGDTTLIIGILDTGVEWDHPDLADKMVSTGYDFVNDDNDAMDDNGHGTHCAGIAAAATDNGIGIAGVAWKCKILPVKVLNFKGEGSYSNVAQGAVYAADSGVKVINMSLGGYAESSVLKDVLLNIYTSVVIVAAAGNDKQSVEENPFFPAAWPFVIGVEAGDLDSSLASFSNYDPNGPTHSDNGFNYEVRGPGVNIYSTFRGLSYASLNGTSMAAPFVAGVFALVCSHYPSWTPASVMGQIVNNSGKMVNAGSSLTGIPAPKLILCSKTIIDTLPGCDRDAIADAGETVEMVFDIQNIWAQANNVQAELRAHSHEDTMFINILDSTATFGSVSSYAHITNNTNPFQFKVKSGTPNNKDIYFDYEITCDGGYSFTGTFYITAQRGIEVSGIISSNTTWTPDYLYIVTANMLVESGVTLTIEPGTRIQVDSAVYLRFDGRLKAIGTPDSMIVFTSNDPLHEKGWRNLRLGGGDTLKYVEIAYGRGIKTSGDYIGYCWIHDNGYYDGTPKEGGIWLTGPSIVEHNLIQRCHTYNGGYGGGVIFADYSGGIIHYNIVEECPGVLIYCHQNSLTIDHNIFRNSSSGVCFYGQSDVGSVQITHNLIDRQAYAGISFKYFPYISSLIVQNNTITNNEKGTYSNRYRSQGQEITITNNNILYNNYNVYNTRSYSINAHHNYWGTTNTDSIDEWIWDYYDDFDLGKVLYEPFDSTPVVTAPGFLYQVEFNPPPPIGVEIDTITLIFSKPMDVSIQPKVSFGVCDPWTQHIIEGDWIDSTHWQGTYAFNIMTGDGINHLRATTAKDCKGMEIPKDTRFSFVVDAAGASSQDFVAQAGIKKVDLQWPQPELVDLMGYNMYRYQQLTDTTFSDTTLVNNQLILDTIYTDTSVNIDTTYFYMFTAISTDFNESDYSKCMSATPYGPGVEDKELLPIKYVLFQNFPNPIHSKTQIKYGLPTLSKVSLRIYNIAGQEICTLVDKSQKPGYYTIKWNGKDSKGRTIASGVYFYRLEAGKFKRTKKLILMR